MLFITTFYYLLTFRIAKLPTKLLETTLVFLHHFMSQLQGYFQPDDFLSYKLSI